MTGKKEWQKVRSTNGYFADHPNAGRFYVYTEDPYSDNPDKYVTCSEGNGGYEWMEELGFSDFDEFFENVVPETVKCFQEYYGDNTIR